MRVFVYEFITGGGMWSLGSESPTGSLLAEGRAMAAAVCADLARIPGVRINALLDVRLAPFHPRGVQTATVDSGGCERAMFLAAAAAADWTLLIAPELAGKLSERSEWAPAVGGRLLSPGNDIVRLTSDKHATAQHLARCGIRVPSGVIAGRSSGGRGTEFPAVLKPQDGCGSLGVRRIASQAELDALQLDQPMRLETFVGGTPASVALLCGPDRLVALPACEQRLGGNFTYLGGRLPLAAALDERARQLALAAVATLRSPLGYLGVDLVLGDDSDGLEDYVIEINPRLTTSYAGLRALCRENLAAAMLAVASGQPPALSWHEGGVQFLADGRVERTANPIATWHEA